MEKELKIRRITLNDAEDIQRIIRAISGDTSEIDFGKVINHNYGDEESKISIAAEINGRVAGFMISNILYAGFGLDRSAWIVNLGVDPDLMGQGIGKKMAEEIFEIYRKRGIKHIYSSVMWDSIDLLSFFKTLGFERSNFINLCKKI